MAHNLIRRTRLGVIGKVHLFVLHFLDVFSRSHETSDSRIDHAAAALDKANRTFFKSVRVFNVHKAIMLIGTGGAGSAEDVVYKPELVEDYREIMHLQHEILSSKKYRADLRAVSGPKYFEDFFWESLHRCFLQKDIDSRLERLIIGEPYSDGRSVAEFSRDRIDQIIDSSPEKLAKDYGYDGQIRKTQA